MEWRYVKFGACEYCALDGVRLRTPVIPGLNAVTPPLFCIQCKQRLEALWKANPDTLPLALLEQQARRPW